MGELPCFSFISSRYDTRVLLPEKPITFIGLHKHDCTSSARKPFNTFVSNGCRGRLNRVFLDFKRYSINVYASTNLCVLTVQYVMVCPTIFERCSGRLNRSNKLIYKRSIIISFYVIQTIYVCHDLFGKIEPNVLSLKTDLIAYFIDLFFQELLLCN